MAKKYKKQVYLGFGPDGKQIRKWFYGDTKAELNQNILKYRIEAEKVQNPSESTFSEYAEQWFKIYKSDRSKQTQDMYRNALKKCSALDPYPVKKITRSACQKVVAECWQHPRTARIVADTLKQIFKSAVMDGMIALNPAEKLSLPKKAPAKFHLLTEAELEAVDKAKLNDQDRLFVTILRIFGLRPGEALALQPTDFDWKRGVLKITKALELANDGTSRIKETKTGVSREIPIPGQLIPSLRERIRGISGFLLFPKATGGLYTKNAYRRLSERVLKAINEAAGGNDFINLIPDVTLYSFRHRRATDLYYLTQSGQISTKKAAALMGHSELVFLTTYSHIMESRETADIYSNAALPAAENL